MAACFCDGAVRIWDLGSAQLQSVLRSSETVTAVEFPPQGPLQRTIIACGTLSGKVQLWDLQSSSIARSWTCHQDAVVSMAFSSDCRVLASRAIDSFDVEIRDTFDNLKKGTIKVDGAQHRYFVEELDLEHGEMKRFERTFNLLSGNLVKPRRQRSGLSLEGSWITLDDKRLLKLPVDVDPDLHYQFGHTFVFANKAGQMTFLEIDVEYLRGTGFW